MLMSLFRKKTFGPLKQVILVRADLKLPKGKAAAQVAHASVAAVLSADKALVDAWRATGMKKVVLKVPGERELLSFQRVAKRKGLVVALITDAGKTVVAPGTRTALAIGPGDEHLIDSMTGHLPLF